MRQALITKLADHDNEIMIAYLEGNEIEPEDVKTGAAAGHPDE